MNAAGCEDLGLIGSNNAATLLLLRLEMAVRHKKKKELIKQGPSIG